MQYCVIVNISRSQISFFYQQRSGKVMPLEFDGVNVHPLYFYLHNNNFSFGTFAKQQFLNGDPNAFGNYFDIITQPSKTFNFYGNEKNIKYLLYHAIEFALNNFFNTVLYEPNSIESYRTDFPLRFIFESDIQEKEKRLIEQLFLEAGFQNFEILSLDRFLFEELIEINYLKKFDSVIKVQSINGSLFLLYFDEDYSAPKYSASFLGLGTDPRLRITAEFIFNSAIAITRASLNKEDEISNLIQFARQFLASGSAQPRGNVILSDGSKPFVTIKMREVNEKISYLGFDTKIFNAIDNFIKEYNISSSANLKFILVGEEINSEYFVDKLSNKYSNIVSTKQIVVHNALERAAKFVESKNYCAQESKRPGIPTVPKNNAGDNKQSVHVVVTKPPMPKIPEKPKASENLKPKPQMPQLPEKMKTKDESTGKPQMPKLPDKKDNGSKGKIVSAPPLPPIKKKVMETN